MIAVEILISGLCAFARESCAVKNAKTLHVLTVNHETHEPRLAVESAFVYPLTEAEEKDSALYSPDEVIELPNGRQVLVWNLRGFRVEFDPVFTVGIREGTRDSTVKEPDLSNGATKNLPTDFSWLPRLDLATGVNDVKKGLADQDALNAAMPPGYVSSRLMPLQVNPTDTNQDNWVEAVIAPPWQNKTFDFGNGYEQVLADGVRMKLQLPKEPTINLYSYSQKKVTKTIRLRALSVDPIPVSISNLPSKLEHYRQGIPLHHFMALYDVLADHPDQKRNLPKEPTGSGTQPVKCTLCTVCGGE